MRFLCLLLALLPGPASAQAGRFLPAVGKVAVLRGLRLDEYFFTGR